MGSSPTRTHAVTEATIRTRIIDDLVSEFAEADGPVLIVQELGLGRGSARADVVVIHAEAIIGFEIKSANDTLVRLPKQAEWYGRVCDRCALAGDPTHVEEAAGILPEWWGLTAVDNDGSRAIRSAKPNPHQDPVALANLLWMPELKSAVAEAGQLGGTAGMERNDLASVFPAAAGARTGPLVRQLLMDRHWMDINPPRGPVRVVRQPDLKKKTALRARVQSKYERRVLKDR